MNKIHKDQIIRPIKHISIWCLYALIALQTSQSAWGQGVSPVNCVTSCVAISVRKLSADPTKNTNFVGSSAQNNSPLPVPAFDLKDGYVPYGSSVLVTAAGLPTGASVEYSSDGGATWANGQQVTVLAETSILARTRRGDQVSTTVQGRFAPYFRRVFVLGNSITAIGPVSSIGWFGNWGMAASAAEKDYLHILSSRLRERNPTVQVQAIAGSSFERSWWTYNMPLSLSEHLQFKPDLQGPDLIIVRIAENMDNMLVQSQNLEQYYGQLLDYLRQFSNGPVKVVVTTSFWQGQDTINGVIRKVAAAKGYGIADLRVLADDPAYRATQYSDPGVALHPNDAGMQQIADLIWAKIK